MSQFRAMFRGRVTGAVVSPVTVDGPAEAAVSALYAHVAAAVGHREVEVWLHVDDASEGRWEAQVLVGGKPAGTGILEPVDTGTPVP